MEIRVYEPDSNRGWGPASWGRMFTAVWAGRALMWVLFRRNFSAAYRQTLFGWLGTVLDPMLMVAPFMTMAFAGILRPGEINAPYPAFALLGLTMFHIGNESIRECSNAISAGASIVVKVNFAKVVLVFARIAQIAINMLIRLAFVGVILAAYRFVPPWTALLFPLAVLPMFIFGVGLGLVLAAMSVVMRDVGKYVSMLMPFFLLMSPILYKSPRLPLLVAFNSYNPFAVLVDAPRDLILYGQFSNPQAFAYMTGFSVVLFFLGWRLFHVSEVHLAAQLGAK